MMDSQRPVASCCAGARGHMHHSWGITNPPVKFRRMSETPTTTTSKESIAIHLQFVLQYASNLYCSTFGAPTLWGQGILSVLLPFVSQYASHLYCNMPPICIAVLLGKKWCCGDEDVLQAWPGFQERRVDSKGRLAFITGVWRSEEQLALPSLAQQKIQDEEVSMTVLAVSVAMAVVVVPWLPSETPFSVILSGHVTVHPSHQGSSRRANRKETDWQNPRMAPLLI